MKSVRNYRISHKKEPKTHGLEKRIEGSPEEPIVISDDVITSGQRVKDAIDALNQARYSAKGVVRDRQRGRWDGECSKGA